MGAMTVQVDVGPMTMDDVVAVARGGAPVTLTEAAEAAIGRARAVVEGAGGGADARVRDLDGVRRAGHPPHPGRDARTAAAVLVRSHAAGSGPEVEREVVRALMLLRLSTLATGRTGHPPRDRAAAGRPASARHHPGGPRVRLARLLRRPRAAVALRAGPDGRGTGTRADGSPTAGRHRAGRGRAPTGRAGGQGGAGADQRHRRHARHAGAGAARPAEPRAATPTSPPR